MKGRQLTTVEFAGEKFISDMRAKGWSAAKLSRAVGRNDQYIKWASNMQRVNYKTLVEMCKLLELDPADYTHIEECRPMITAGTPEPVVLNDEEAVAIFTAIVSRAKEDYILAYRDMLRGKTKRREGGALWLEVSRIEDELTAEWFRDHLIGAITTDSQAINRLLTNWRHEAERSLMK